MNKILVVILSLIATSSCVFGAAGKIQNADVMSSTQIISAGGTIAQLINDTKIYVSALGINKQLSQAITDGDLSGTSTELGYVYTVVPCTSSPCTIADQGGPHGNWVSSITRTAGGHYVINVTGVTCTGNVICVVDYNGTDNGGCSSANFQALSTTQYPVHCYSSAHSDQDTSNGGFDAFCKCKI